MTVFGRPLKLVAVKCDGGSSPWTAASRGMWYGSTDVTERGESRRIAIRASVWTVILLFVAVSSVLLIGGIAEADRMEVLLGTLAAVLAALAAATMHITNKIECGALSYTRGFREGFSEARIVNSVVPFSTEREPSRR